jgi:threonine dehydratase
MPSSPSLTEPDADDVDRARPAVEELARRTPLLSTRTISERAGGVVAR